MVGVLLTSHGELCKQLMESSAMIAGAAMQMRAVPLEKGENPEAYKERVRAALFELDTGAGVIVLVDVLGGTPYNTVGFLSRSADIQIITGMNLPMVLSLTLERDESSKICDLVEQVSAGARAGIKVLCRKNKEE